jgi:hypothetical protein
MSKFLFSAEVCNFTLGRSPGSKRHLRTGCVSFPGFLPSGYCCSFSLFTVAGPRRHLSGLPF